MCLGDVPMRQGLHCYPPSSLPTRRAHRQHDRRLFEAVVAPHDAAWLKGSDEARLKGVAKC